MAQFTSLINIETQSSGDGLTFYVFAAYIAGTVLLGLVIFLGVGVVQFTKGKLFADSEASKKGLRTAGLSLAGAVLLGTTAGAVAWSADDSTYDQFTGGGGLAALMPPGARPQEVTVERQGARVTCPETVSIEAENSSPSQASFSSTYATVEEHEEMEAILEQNQGLDAAKQEMVGKQIGARQMDREITEDNIDELWGSEDGTAVRIASIEWHPADNSEGCNSGNTEAVPDTTMYLTVWVGSGESWYDNSNWFNIEIERP